jgi:threonine dehydrogenase-like Zn-dependent dehydrogenase
VTIRALTYHGTGDIRCESHPDPTPPDEHGAVLKVERAAICGSDLHLYHGAMPPGQTGFAVGHEFVGEIVEVGSAVRDFKTGDRVLTSGVIGCGLCGSCRSGRVVRCEQRQTRVFGMGTALPGGQAEAVAVPGADHAFKKIPDGVNVEQAVLLTDILPTAYYGALQADIEPGHTVAVIGLGPVGLLAVECARLFGPARILAIDRIPERLAQAKALGAEPVHVDRAAEVAAAANGGMGPDAVIEAVGADATIQLAIAICRSR